MTSPMKSRTAPEANTSEWNAMFHRERSDRAATDGETSDLGGEVIEEAILQRLSHNAIDHLEFQDDDTGGEHQKVPSNRWQNVFAEAIHSDNKNVPGHGQPSKRRRLSSLRDTQDIENILPTYVLPGQGNEVRSLIFRKIKRTKQRLFSGE